MIREIKVVAWLLTPEAPSVSGILHSTYQEQLEQFYILHLKDDPTIIITDREVDYRIHYVLTLCCISGLHCYDGPANP
jgi:hypothetical protein